MDKDSTSVSSTGGRKPKAKGSAKGNGAANGAAEVAVQTMPNMQASHNGLQAAVLPLPSEARQPGAGVCQHTPLLA